jgi:hypothetical protein
MGAGLDPGKAANRVRVSAQLIEAENGHHLWAERYDRDLTDVFSLQDEITISVVAAIEPNLCQAEIERVRRKRPNAIDAYDLLLRALPSVYTGMPDGAGKALLQLEQASGFGGGICGAREDAGAPRSSASRPRTEPPAAAGREQRGADGGSLLRR